MQQPGCLRCLHKDWWEKKKNPRSDCTHYSVTKYITVQQSTTRSQTLTCFYHLNFWSKVTACVSHICGLYSFISRFLTASCSIFTTLISPQIAPFFSLLPLCPSLWFVSKQLFVTLNPKIPQKFQFWFSSPRAVRSLVLPPLTTSPPQASQLMIICHHLTLSPASSAEGAGLRWRLMVRGTLS